MVDFFLYRVFNFSFLIAVSVCIFSTHSVFSQDTTKIIQTDTIFVLKEKPHSPGKAALMSAIVPGLGQAYNKKYWKIPVVYGAIGVSVYFAKENDKFYSKYRNALKIRLDDDPNTIDDYQGIMSVQNLESNVNYYQRNRDLSVILAGVFYALNIIDATVDAHLFSFPKNDNLSFDVRPSFQVTQNNQVVNGISLALKF
ncbi:MAG: hypothetical protein CO022_08660 [Flavobacteriales bacterium CG_4_9_14_0_2_um_filter_32_27]|nr:MAG: hypothetical protein CO022_08660 [Flavobacteriales bacterium CG_4_9_14_0_2_um_filter_32_27]